MKFKFLLSLLLSIVFVSANAQGFSNIKVGAHVGYGINGHLPIGVNLQSNRFIYGLSANLSISKDLKGENYTGTVNWDEYPEDHVNEGSYKQSVTFDLGYFLNEKLAVGGGIGYGWTTYYRNCFDNLHILGNNGSYYIEANGDGILDAKAFLLYRFPVSSYFNIYIKAGYGIISSAFICVGIQI